jgi:hypothetical protein
MEKKFYYCDRCEQAIQNFNDDNNTFKVGWGLDEKDWVYKHYCDKCAKEFKLVWLQSEPV